MRMVAPAAALVLLAFAGGSPAGRAAASPPCPGGYDLLLRGGTVVDGSGAPRRRADVAVCGAHIAAIGDLSAAAAARVIDASGLVVAPGFIDMLGWSQYTVLVDNRGLSKVTQGITTEVSGEGFSPAPVSAATLREDSSWLAAHGLVVDWRDFDGYMRRLERRGLPFNVATLVGAATVRLYVIGRERRAPTPDELARMRAVVDTAMQQGAFGLGAALIYEPGAYASTGELIALAAAAGAHGGFYASHIRDEGDGIRRALAEAFRIGREARVPVEIWHLKVTGRSRGSMRSILGLLDSARAAGLRVGANSYPYTAAGRSMTASLPLWARAGGPDSLLRRLRSPAARARIRRETRGLGNQLVLGVLDTSLRRYQGRRFTDIARDEGRHPADVLMDIVLTDQASPNTSVAVFGMLEDDVRAALRDTTVGVVTDRGATAPDGPLAGEAPHPRAYGTFPRILGRYVREEHLLSLEAAVRKMTGIAADRFGITGRGYLREGYFADITVFDPATVADRATFGAPHQVATGISYVVVNGRLTLDAGLATAERPGRALRGPGWRAP